MMKEATRLIRSESGSSLLFYLQEMDVNRGRDDVKAEALEAGAWGMLAVGTGNIGEYRSGG